MNLIKTISLFLSIFFCTFLCNAERTDKHVYWCNSVDSVESEKYPLDEVFKCNIESGQITKICDLRGYLIDSYETNFLYAAELDISGEKLVWNIIRMDLNGNREWRWGPFDADQIVRFLAYANDTLYYLKALEEGFAVYEGIDRDGKVISYSQDAIISVWRDIDGDTVYPYRENYESYLGIVSPDGKIISSISYHLEDEVFQADALDLLLYLPGQEIINLGRIYNPSWIDENHFFYYSDDMRLRIYDVQSRSFEYYTDRCNNPLEVLEHDEEAYFCVSNNGKYAIFTPYDDWVLRSPYPQIMNLESRDVKKLRKIHAREVMNAKLFLMDF